VNEPRVLLINPHTFGSGRGDAIALNNYFSAWPRERLASIYSEDMALDHSVCANFFQLTDAETRAMWFLPGLNRVRRGVTPGSNEADAAPSRRARLIRSAARVVSADGVRHNPRISPELDKWIRQFQPDVIYTTLGSLYFVRLTSEISERYKLPSVVHITDDWPNVFYRNGLLAPYLRFSLKHDLGRLVKSAAAVISISDTMRDAFAKRYGRVFDVMSPPVNVAEWAGAPRDVSQIHSLFRIGYVGTIFPSAQLGSLRRLAQVVKTLRGEGFSCELRIHTPKPFIEKYQAGLAEGNAVRFLEHPERDELPALLREMDLLVVPVNFDAESLQYITYSMPGKVAAYMASGTPILVFGPPQVAPVQYAHKSGWAHVVSDDDDSAIATAIKKLAADQDYRRELSSRAQEVARTKHDISTARAQIRLAIDRAIANA
jgi:glycosyltransferase involved in cell wall biosynthesis